jgi:hypothetical protein
MRTLFAYFVALLTLISSEYVSVATADVPEKRIALVIGNAAYRTGALPTAANDAGLIAQTLQAAGFDVVGARDLDQDSLRRAFREFLEKASSSDRIRSPSSMSVAMGCSSKEKITSCQSTQRSDGIPM